MPRNKSEKVPHPHLSKLYHERARAWALFKLSGTVESEDAWHKAYRAWASDDESVSDEGNIHKDVFMELKVFYTNQARAAGKAS